MRVRGRVFFFFFVGVEGAAGGQRDRERGSGMMRRAKELSRRMNAAIHAW
jgi:hypothetical protein